MGLLLNLYPWSTIADLAAVTDEPDEELLTEALIPHPSGIKALLAPARPELADTVTPALITNILRQLRTNFDIIIIDTGHIIDERVLQILDQSDKIILVAASQLAAIKNAKLFFEVADTLDYEPDRLIFVLNKASKRDNICDKDIEANIKRPIESQLPLDEGVALEAENKGLPYVLGAKRSQLARTTVALSQQVRQLLPQEIS